jgi:hypothetical protein
VTGVDDLALVETLIGYDTSTEEGIQRAVGFLRGWLEGQSIGYRVSEVNGRPAVVAAWLTDPDEPGSWEADYEVLAIDGDTYVAHGRTRYLTDDRSTVDREFANVFVCRFDTDGRCREFTEWYMRRRPEAVPD